MSDDYRPIDCSLHDRLEDLAVRRRVVRIRYRADDGPAELEDAIADWFARDGVEYARTVGGATIRLDHIIEVDGVTFR